MDSDNTKVRFNNKMNELNLKEFNEQDLNFLMAVFSKIKNKGERIQISYDEIKKATGYRKRNGNDYFNSIIQHMAEKGRRLGGTVRFGEKFVSGNVFSCFVGEDDKQILHVRLNPDCYFMLNNLITNFTEFELKKYLEIKGTYAKTLFQHLCQYRTKGFWQVSKKDLAFYLNIPESMDGHKYSYQVIKPSIKELTSKDVFKNLKFETIKNGKTIIAYKFTFDPEKVKKSKVKENQFNKFDQTSYQQMDFDEFEKSILSN